MNNKGRLPLMLTAWILFLACIARGAPSDADSGQWRAREMLVNRLGAEWYRIGLLKRELTHIKDIAEDLRNLELYPETITRLTPSRLVAFDRRIEQIEKSHQKISVELEGLRAPLSDALAILREMVTGEPVEEMYRVLERGDMQRLALIVDIKHRIDDLWNETSDLIGYAARSMELGQPDEEATRPDEEFFAILKANLGRQWEEHYAQMSRIKDSLALRANAAETRLLFSIESEQVSEYVKRNKHVLAKRKLRNIASRYQNSVELDKIRLLLARVHFALGEYRVALETAALLPDTPPLGQKKILIQLQSWYALGDYRSIWEWSKQLNFAILNGKERNLALWITIEAGLTLGVDEDFSRLAGFMAKDASYNIHVLHALARTYAARDRWPTAMSVLRSGIRLKPLAETDQAAHQRIQLATAQTLYETGQYEEALELFFSLLNKDEGFDEALFGIAWCYISLGQYQNAESTLRTLINQNPESPRAAQAILLMAKRYVNKARHEWEKKLFLSKQHDKITVLLQKLQKRIAQSPAAAEKQKIAVAELREILSRIRAERIATADEIAGYYQKGRRICTIVTSLYETGSFQEISFSERREQMLHDLDSILLAIHSDSEKSTSREASFSKAQRDIHRIKALVKKANVMAAEVAINEHRWQKDYHEFQKSTIKERERALLAQCQSAESGDSATCIRKRDKLTALIDSLVAAEDRLRRNWESTYPASITALLESGLAPADEIYLRYHLAELYYKQENARFASEYERYEVALVAYQSQMELFHKGRMLEMPREPEQPRLRHEQSVSEYRRILEKYPDHPHCAPVRYGLAWCYNDIGKHDSAVAQMQIVAADYPQSQYAAQAMMFVGEHFFENAQLQKAIKAYQAVMNYPESEWFDEALYKLAWTQYRLSNPEKAISSFLALVDLGDAEAAQPLLEKESMDYIAISFSESDVTGEKGLKRAARFVTKFGDERRGSQILHRLAKVYREQGRFDMAKKTCRTLLSMYPDNPTNYLVESELLAVLERDADLAKTAEMKIAYFEKYSSESEWAGMQADTTITTRADSAAAHHLYDAALSLHQNALQNNDSTEYGAAADAYRKFIRAYPLSMHANECHYNLAEILFSLGNYQQAAEEYMAVSIRYPDSKYRETAAWNAIVASQNLLRLEGEKKQ